jgi:hypothetical protein
MGVVFTLDIIVTDKPIRNLYFSPVHMTVSATFTLSA